MFRFAAALKSHTPASTLMRVGAVSAACLALTLAGCGGGDRAKDYYPDRIVSFGDENSALENFSSTTLDPAGTATKTVQGLVYTVNPVATTAISYCTDTTANALCSNAITETVSGYTSGTAHGYYFDSVNNHNPVDNVIDFIDVGAGIYQTGGSSAVPLKRDVRAAYICSASTIWNQVVAHAFDKGFGDVCALDIDGAVSYAAFGAKLADVKNQIAAHRGELKDGVLVTLMVGQNDILELYDAVRAGSKTDAAAISELKDRGGNLSATVKDLLSTGAKVVLALTPDLGQSPKAHASGEDQDKLSRYTKAFNDAAKLQLGTETSQDGRHLALVETDLFTNPITRNSSSSYNWDTAACVASNYIKPDGSSGTGSGYDAVKYCTSNTLASDVSTTTYIWADSIHFAPAGHSLVGLQGSQRAANQF